MSDMEALVDNLDAEIAALRAENERLKAEIADLKISAIPFLALWAAQYQKLYELDGFHPAHYDLLEKCGARMAEFKRASLSGEPGAEPQK